MYHDKPIRGRTHLTFIGGGTMACAILDGLVESPSTAFRPGQKPEYSFSITARRQERVVQLSERYPGAYVADNNDDEKLWLFAKDDQLASHIILSARNRSQRSMYVRASVLRTKKRQCHATCRLWSQCLLASRFRSLKAG